jgi:hypothetical protein
MAFFPTTLAPHCVWCSAVSNLLAISRSDKKANDEAWNFLAKL